MCARAAAIAAPSCCGSARNVTNGIRSWKSASRRRRIHRRKSKSGIDESHARTHASVHPLSTVPTNLQAPRRTSSAMALARTVVRVLLAVIGSAAIVALAFLLRFDAMGGALAGFDDEEFRKLARVDLVLAGERPLRDFTDGELRGVWPSLGDEYPALAQRLWGRNLLTHAALTCGTLAFCAALVFLLARHLARSWLVALLAALAVVGSYPHLYNYPKVLTLTVGI